jgi:membrane associated rhomboid family serine protease
MRLIGYTSILLIANIVVFILQLMLGNSFTNKFILIGELAASQPWMYVTYMFFHADLLHLLFNMFGLYMFGSLVERKIGSNKFLALYFGAGIVAAIIGSFIYPSALGASAAVVAVVGAAILFFPNAQILFWGIIPMKMWQFGVLFVFIEIYTGAFIQNNVGNIAHLIGFSIGLGYAYYFVKFVEKGLLKKVQKVAKGQTVEVLDGTQYQEYVKKNK